MQERKEREKEMRNIARYQIKELKRMEQAIEKNPTKELERIKDQRRALEKELKKNGLQKARRN
jgi:vacuolar-type H+-ATPase subunit I/STV1